MADLDKILLVFEGRFAYIQAYTQIKRLLEKHGVSHEEFEEWKKGKAKRVAQAKTTQTRTRKKSYVPPSPQKQTRRACPECGEWLQLTEVNNAPCCMTDDPDMHSVWTCLGSIKKKDSDGEWIEVPTCGWQEFSKKYPAEEAEPYIEDIPVNEPRPIVRARNKKRKKSRIVHPRDHNMLYYKNINRRG